MKTNNFRNNTGGVICYCINCSVDEETENSACVLRDRGQCYAAMEEQYNPETNEFEVKYSAGCLPPNEQIVLQCEGARVPSQFKRVMKCCSFTDYCNKNLLPPYKPRVNVTSPHLTSDNSVLGPIIGFSSVFIIAAILCVMIMLYKYAKRNGSRKYVAKLDSIKVSKFYNHLHNCTQGSGPDDGQLLLPTHTITYEVKKECLLGKGRFKEKWIVNRKGDKIVMKIFTSWEEDQWAREKSIYSTGLHHANVLRLINSDSTDGLRCIFTYYHRNGSLHDYIKNKCLNNREFLTIARSAANGVKILHQEICGTCTRPSIVHRNITSKNFLINDRGECEICDFEVALMENEDIDSKMDLKVGTPRYSAPEIVDETINSFEKFKMADIYSLGLVFWEICRRSVTISEDYALPFADILPENPTMEDMKHLFATKITTHELLGIPVTWEKYKLLSNFTLIVKECTSRINTTRPTAVRIAKQLTELENE